MQEVTDMRPSYQSRPSYKAESRACKYDYKAAGVVDLGTISIRRCSGRGVVEFLTEGHRHEWSLCRT